MNQQLCLALCAWLAWGTAGAQSVTVVHRAVELQLLDPTVSLQWMHLEVGKPVVRFADTTISGEFVPGGWDLEHPQPRPSFNGAWYYLQSDTMELVGGTAELSFQWQFYGVRLERFLRKDSVLLIEHQVVDVDADKVIEISLKAMVGKGSLVLDSLTGQWVYAFNAIGTRRLQFQAREGQRIVTKTIVNTTALVDSSELQWALNRISILYTDTAQYLENNPFLQHDLPSFITNVVASVGDGPNHVYTFQLGQNYPNPFNPATRIGFSIPRAGLVSLKILDVLGREVCTLLNEERPAGYQEVPFEAGSLPSGVYFYRIDFEGSSIVRKMMLLK